MNSRQYILFFACAWTLGACGGRAHAPNSRANGGDGSGGTSAAGASMGGIGAGASVGGTGAGASAGWDGGAGSTTWCPSDLPDAQELAATPRADTNVELLALRFSNGVVADQAIYDRLSRDLTLITDQDSSVSDIHYFPPSDGKGLLLQTDSQTASEMQAGTYTAWNCLNDAYGLQNTIISVGSVPFVELELEGIYDIERVAKQYAALPGIKSASSNIGGGDGPTICVVRKDDAWHYVFDRASGDCLAGCYEHEYTHFTVSTNGTVSALGALSAADAKLYASREVCR